MIAPFASLAGRLTLVDLLLLLAPVVVVPLGLRLMPLTGRLAAQVLCVARLAQPVGAVAAIISFLLPSGWTAGAIAVGWLITCGVGSLAGLVELVESRSVAPRRLAPAAALAFLSVGAAWLVASRLGLRPLGFSPAIVELTGMHFHYAGFAATLMAGLTVGALVSRDLWLRRWAAAAALLVVAGVPLTAVGIATGSPLFTVVGPSLLGAGILSVAALTAFAVVPRVPSSAARWLLRISAAGVVVPMILGVDYALGRVFAIPSLSIEWMALIHGDLNALVFALLGLLGWTLAKAGSQSSLEDVA